jgi:pimeloyl-ACP methyl ester carboxylesterase
MKRLIGQNGTVISYDEADAGPPLVLVHGGFSDHHTNWEFVAPALRERFRILAIARRGRGETEATDGHTLEDEANDVVALIRAAGAPVFLLGHSYGAQCALAAALGIADRVRKLIVYEPPTPELLKPTDLARLEALAATREWDHFAVTFFRDVLKVPDDDLRAVRESELWPPIVADGKASLGDLRALTRYRFQVERWRALKTPVLLQIGSESPRELYATDALAAVLPDVRVETLCGQAHEGMTTAPNQYVQSLTWFLLDDERPALVRAGAA